MILRWKHALAAYALLLFAGSTGYSITLIFGDCTGCGASAVFLWPYVFAFAAICSLPGFLFFRSYLNGRESYATALFAGAVLGLLAAMCFFLLFSAWPSAWALTGFFALGGLAGASQLCLERAFERRWPL